MAFGGRGANWGWPPPPLDQVATLDEEIKLRVIQVWQRLEKSSNIELLRLPLHQWESSLVRSGFEDRLIDAWISLEALLHWGTRGQVELSGGSAAC